jgi:hypothetical protein
MFGGEEIQHHSSLADLRAAGNSGCRLCSLITSHSPYPMFGGKKNPEIVCEVAWDVCDEFPDYEGADSIQAIRFRDSKSSFGHDGFSCTVGICTTEGQ